MTLLLKNKNCPPSANPIKKQVPQTKQTKNKTCIIKLQVNKFLKSEVKKLNFHKSTKSEQLDSHHTSQVLHEHQKSLENQVESKPEKKFIKTFQQLYFEKIKQLKLQQNFFASFSSNHEKFVLTDKIRPSSCKNIVSIKSKNRPNLLAPQSTKNLTSEENKQNVLNQNSNESNFTKKQSKFFKKNQQITELDLCHKNNISSSAQKVSEKASIQKEEIFQDQKVKKILKIRRVSKINKEQSFEKLNNNFFQRPIVQNPNSVFLEMKKQADSVQKLAKTSEKWLLSPISSCLNHLNPSLQLKTFKQSSLSQSAEKHLQFSITQSRFDEIIDTRINHSLHEHIWDGIECFFSLEEFEFILQELGFQGSFHNKEIGFYVNKLWEHLGGDLYGGVVRKNMRHFLSILLEDENDTRSGVTQAQTSKEELPIDENFIDKGSLKLVNLSQEVKDQIKRFYFPFRISKIASQIHLLHIKENSSGKLHNSINSTEQFSEKSKQKLSSQKAFSSNRSNQSILPQPKEIYLENNAYLDTISVKNRHQDLSPCMIPRIYQSSCEMDLVTDFSPKMPAQKYEPFKSTILNKDDFVLEKLSTEQQEEHQIEQKTPRKPLLSVDVNLGEGILQKLLVYEDQNPYEISLKLKERYNIDEQLRQKFQKMLKNHLNSLLFKIEEVSEELFQDSVELKNQDYMKDFVLMEKE